ncbi:MAG: PspC domain-containing protein [Defluviitaleaceae bacterium]|nr:PspC domain-containing protein [Defluviitaleaceae bacterium]
MEDKKLYRSNTNRKLSGVCGGMAQFLNIDPTIVRVVWVVAPFLLPFIGFLFAVIAYVVCAVVIPEAPPHDPPSSEWQQ